MNLIFEPNDGSLTRVTVGMGMIFPMGDPHRIPMGSTWGFPQDSYGNGMGMGIEISFPRQSCL